MTAFHAFFYAFSDRMTALIQQGVKKGIIKFDVENKYITYIHQDKKRNYQNPEEKVQAETFCKLILEYGYSEKHIQQFVSVKMGVADKQADIIVYADEEFIKPLIIVECKSETITELEFQEAVKQAYSYSHALAGTTKFVWVTKGNREEFYKFDKEKNQKTVTNNIPYFGESDTPKYTYAKGGSYKDHKEGKEVNIKAKDLLPIAESDLTRIFKQAHDALWGGGELNPTQAFDELDKLIFCKVWDERNTKKNDAYQFQIFRDDTAEELQKRIFAIYDLGKEKDPEIFNKPIDLSAERTKTIVEYFQSVSFSKTDLDSKGKAFETFLGSYFRGEFGAYFTPRPVVKFAVEAMPITKDSKVLDTSCGSGGFLLYALDKVRKQADEIYPNHETDVEEYADWKPYWHNFASEKLFGIEINDQISRVAKMNMIIHDDGHTNVIQHDGLFDIETIAKNSGNKGFAENSFDVITTNPPFGSIAKQSEKAYMQSDKRTAAYYDFSLKEMNWIDAKIKNNHLATGRENQSTEVLFIEQCHKFLKVNGYLAAVVPDGILTNSSLAYVRESIEEKYRIVSVISLPQTAFTATGAGVKSSVLILRKYPVKTTQKIKSIKIALQDRLAKEVELFETIEKYDKEKKEELKPLTAKDEQTIAKRKEVSDEYTEKINTFKEELEELYQAEKQKQLYDYPIFMAIADNIGYDASGKNCYKIISTEEGKTYKGRTVYEETQEHDLFTTKVMKERVLYDGKINEVAVKETLVPKTGILGELKTFIEAIENGTDSFFL
jgi:type I restriction enzyme M protein